MAENINHRIRMRYLFITIIFVVLVVLILLCMVNVAFVEGDSWRKLGAKQERPNVSVPAVRGNIYSADYELMATTEYRYRLFMDFWASIQVDTLHAHVGDLAVELNKLFPQKSATYYKNHILNGLSQKQREESNIAKGIKTSKRSREYRLLDHEVNYLELKKIRQMPFFNKGRYASGLYEKERVRRVKPYGMLASRTVGDIFAETDKGGRSGLESYYDELLRGEPGVSTRKKVNGRWINVIDVEPINGMDVVATIDVRIQDITEKALYNKLRELDAEAGCAVVMEVETGEIKAISNLGRVRPGEWQETQNYAISDLSEPGSTFKVVSMMVALEDGVVRPDDIVETGNGLYSYGGSVVRDHNAHRGGYQTITAAKAIRYSSNVGVAKIILKGYENNPTKYVQGIHRIGIQKDLGLEFHGYAKPVIRFPNDSVRYWSRTTLPWMSFGYETQVPPISTLTFFNAIANGGKMMKPIFVKEIQRDGKTEEKKRPVVINDKICSEQTLTAIQQMLWDVVNESDGTGKPAKSDLVSVSGKTGTAQLSQGAAGYKAGGLSHQVSFCGYYPSEKPKYSCIVVIRRPKGVPSGGSMCGSVFKQIAEELYAQNLITKNTKMPVDTIHSVYPNIKDGLFDISKYAIKSLGVQYNDSVTGEWTAARSGKEGIVLKDRTVSLDHVPSVIGMGAKDAVYALESLGLVVSLQGQGTVRSQSISPRSNVVRGQTIVLNLR